MTTPIDIAIVVDCSLSMSFYSKQIRKILLSCFSSGLSYDENDIRMALIEFQSHTDDWVTKVHPFTPSISTFQEWLNAVETKGENFDECKAIADALDVCLTLDWRSNNYNNQYYEKLVILFTDGPPCNFFEHKCPYESCDLWRMSDKLAEENITLIVIGIEPCVLVCDDFYYALARKTGGEYIPLINAYHILPFVIEQTILSEYTISQLLRRLDIHDDIEINSLYNYASVEKRAWYMIEYCQTITDIRRELYTYRYPPQTDSANEYNLEPNSPIINMGFYDYWNDNTGLLSSTPVTDDEGYRTRLPTTASPGSSFIYINGSPICFYRTNLSSNSDIDDQSI